MSYPKQNILFLWVDSSFFKKQVIILKMVKIELSFSNKLKIFGLKRVKLDPATTFVSSQANVMDLLDSHSDQKKEKQYAPWITPLLDSWSDTSARTPSADPGPGLPFQSLPTWDYMFIKGEHLKS